MATATQPTKAEKTIAYARGLLAHHPDPNVRRAWELLGAAQKELQHAPTR